MQVSRTRSCAHRHKKWLRIQITTRGRLVPTSDYSLCVQLRIRSFIFSRHPLDAPVKCTVFRFDSLSSARDMTLHT